MGDSITKVGFDNTGYEEVIGRHAIGLIDYLRFYVPLKNFFSLNMETSPLPVKGCKI
jgi:hypothetical protein